MRQENSQSEWRELAEQWRTKNAPPVGLESQVVAEFRRTRSAPPRRANSNRVWWLAAAAVLTLVFSGLAWNRKQDPKPVVAFTQPQPTAPLQAAKQVENPKVEQAVAPKRVAPQLATANRRPPAPGRQKAAAAVTPVSTVSSRETYTEFFPLEEGPISIDRGSVVRVRMPRSAMFRVGLPVNMNRINDSVQADLVLSEDGVARAVRFVQ